MKKYLPNFFAGILGGIVIFAIMHPILYTNTTTLKPRIVLDDFFEHRLQENQTSTFYASLTHFNIENNVILCVHNKNKEAMICKAQKVSDDSYLVTIQAKQKCYPFIEETHIVANEFLFPCYFIILEIDANVQVPGFPI